MEEGQLSKVWKSKLRAAGWHLSISLLVSILAAVLVFGVWYVEPYTQLLQGTQLYQLVLMVEICLGPLMSLVIYNPRKPIREMVVDYSVVGSLQFAALLYGLYVMAIARPVYEVLVKDRWELVAAVQINESDLAQGVVYKDLPWFSPRRVCVEDSLSTEERGQLLFDALEGRDIQFQPKYYRPCSSDEIVSAAFRKEQLNQLTKVDVDRLPESIRAEKFLWLPINSRFGAGIMIYPDGDVANGLFLNIDPFMH